MLVEGDRIAAVGPAAEVRREHKPDIVIDARDKVVMPGLVNLHFHPGTIIRGVGEHMGLEEWAEQILYPYLAAMRPEDAYYAASLAYAEALLTGTTTINLMYAYIFEMGRAAKDIGVRAVLSSEAADLVEGQPTLEENEKAFRELHSPDGKIQVWFGVEWLPICSDEFLLKARELANKYKTGIHIHLNESKGEVEACLKKFGKRPTERAHDLGVMGPDVVAAHCVWLSEREMRLYAETGTHISHNPVSNAKLGNGLAKIPELVELGVNVGLGTDDSACNDTFNMFETMKFASLAQKSRFTDASKMPAMQVLEMATLNGARALGMEREIGSIEAGKKADIVLLDLNVPNMRPVHFGEYSNICQNLVYSSLGNSVDTVLVDGEVVVRGGKLTKVDLDEII
ncbi:MAG: amidohydrolase family protein, partial [Candidatus Hadarchaeum sp.]|uniref:amidohydrolase family protein n=1 Tax=Candidatus Hadarchaeum sp. TaxID=2883567 RepID=UPI003D0D9A74